LPLFDVKRIIVAAAKDQIVGARNATIVRNTQLVAMKLKVSFFSDELKMGFAISSVTMPMLNATRSDFIVKNILIESNLPC
jgi:hypothetical protein